MQRYRLNGTVFIITGMIGRRTDWIVGGQPLPSLPMLTWEEIEHLHHSGMEIGGHTIAHDFLTRCRPEQLRRELHDSRAVLEERLGVQVRSFAYPQGDYNRAVVDATRDAGYTTAVTIDQGRAQVTSDPLRLPRLRCWVPLAPSRRQCRCAYRGSAPGSPPRTGCRWRPSRHP